MKNIEIVIKDSVEFKWFKVQNMFEVKEIQEYMGVLLDQNTKFEFDGNTLTIFDNINIQKLTIKGLFPYLSTPTIIANNIQMLMDTQASVNFDNNIDIVNTNFKQVGAICEAFDLELRHAYNGLNGDSFELNVKG